MLSNNFTILLFFNSNSSLPTSKIPDTSLEFPPQSFYSIFATLKLMLKVFYHPLKLSIDHLFSNNSL
jgi:hypothetical protein